MIARAFTYLVTIVVVFLMATSQPIFQLTIAQTTGNMSSLVWTSENIVNLEIIQESINDAREDIHENNSAEAIEELGTANKALARITNGTTTTSWIDKRIIPFSIWDIFMMMKMKIRRISDQTKKVTLNNKKRKMNGGKTMIMKVRKMKTETFDILFLFITTITTIPRHFIHQ